MTGGRWPRAGGLLRSVGIAPGDCLEHRCIVTGLETSGDDEMPEMDEQQFADDLVVATPERV